MSSTLLYVAMCVPNGKLYFGLTSGSLRDRIKRHLYDAERPRFRFHRAIHKYGPSNFVWFEIGHTTATDAGEFEQTLIRVFGTQNPKKGYNTAAGGQTGPGQTSEVTRQKLRQRRHSDATRARMREAHLGQPSWAKGLKLTPAQKLGRLGNQNRSGKKASVEARARMSRAQVGNRNALGRGTPIETIRAALAEVSMLGLAGTARKYNVSEATVRWWQKRHV